LIQATAAPPAGRNGWVAHLRRWLLVCIALCGAGLAPRAHAETYFFETLEWLPASKDLAPSEGSGTRHKLPLRWTSQDSPDFQTARFRFELRLDATPTEPWALLLSHATEGGRLIINGRFVGEVPTSNERIQVRWRRPHLIPIDPQALVTGNNIITIDSAYGGGTHVLAGVLIGPADELAWRYQRQFFLSHTVTWIGATMAAAIALLFTVLWLRRRESLLALVSVAALLWVGRSSFFLIETMPTEALPWLRLLYYGCSGGFTAFMAIALLRLSGRRGMREAWGIVGYALVGPLLVLVAAPYVTPFIDLLWIPGLIAIAALAWGYATYNRLRNREAPHGPLLAAVLVTLIAAAHDYALWSGWVPDASQLALHWAGPILLVALALPMVDRFVDALRDAEAARAELESRVKEREQLLKRNFERLRATERLQVQAQERQRIMQDMHDGLGTQLLSSLMLVERGALNQQQLAQVLRESIDDMRLAIDALALDDGGLLSALGNFRYRMEPRMRAAGVELQWDAKGLPEEIDVHPDMVLPILRIVQEALTNALKHSGARAVRVSLTMEQVGEEDWLVVRVTDNGRGISGEGVGGRGLMNMRNRAQRIGGQFKIETVPGTGTMVALRYRVTEHHGQPREQQTQLNLNTEAVIERVRGL
jgi:signal transduction histidine kinase